MAGKLTGLKYDRNAYVEEVARSTNPLLYKLDPNYAINCQGNCNARSDQIDVDSILKGITKPKSRSNEQQKPEPLGKYNRPLPHSCYNGIDSECTRYTHPAYDIKGLTVSDMRFDYPLHDPQCQIFENFQVNTRLQAKDNHKAIWQVPLEQKNLLPTERLGRIKTCKN